MQDKVFRTKTTLNFRGKLYDMNNPMVMGILNITPDSFYDGGKYITEQKILSRAEQILDEGAEIIDLGAYSSRPGATHISEEEETKRVISAIDLIHKKIPEAILSVDTFRATIAQKAVDHGAAIINDISGGNMDPQMFETIARLNVPYILMHMQGTPQTMQNAPQYKDVIEDVILELSKKINQLQQLGVNDIIIDPGLGFGKTLDQNYRIINSINRFRILGHPVLIGASRKSMIYKLLETSAEKALNGTTAVNTIALLNGASIIRVHDVKEAVETIKIVNQLKNN